jgi:integrase
MPQNHVLPRQRSVTLALRARKLRTKPYIPKPEGDPSRIREGYFTRDDVDRLCTHLPDVLADVVRFLFCSAWRVGEVRTLEWRDYDRTEGAIRLRPERSKTKHGRVLPLVGELAAIIARRLDARRLDCPYIFHHKGRPIGDFRKSWRAACTAAGLSGRIVHDLRRSGVRHLIPRRGRPAHRDAVQRAPHGVDAEALPHHRFGRPAGSRGSGQRIQRRHHEARSVRNTERTRRVAALRAGVAELAEC